METSFDRLVRFLDVEDQVYYGEAPPVPDPVELVGQSLCIYEGRAPWDEDFHLTDTTKKIQQVLSPLPQVPAFVCVGLNYQRHIMETKSPTPQFPVLFNKACDCLAGPLEDIPVHEDALWMDYEGELCFVIGKTCKDVGPHENPLSYVLGYTVGNDVSSRYWQMPERSSSQASYSKGFDKFAPLGPYLCSATLVPDPGQLRLTTRVNGEVRQDETTADLLFGVEELIRFASRGHTLRPGTVVMTGTPSGVGLGRKPPVFLIDGDVVEIEIERLGIIRNKFLIPANKSPSEKI